MDANSTGSLIYATAFSDGMPHSLCELIEAQSKHETGLYGSKAFTRNNNCFGYKYVRNGKWQTGPGIKSTEGDPYAHYDSIENSVHELTAWIIRRKNEGKFPDLETITTATQYAKLLKECGYYGAPLQEYVNGLKRYLPI